MLLLLLLVVALDLWLLLLLPLSSSSRKTAEGDNNVPCVMLKGFLQYHSIALFAVSQKCAFEDQRGGNMQ